MQEVNNDERGLWKEDSLLSAAPCFANFYSSNKGKPVGGYVSFGCKPISWMKVLNDQLKQVAGRCPGRDSLPVFHVANCSRASGTLPPLFLKCWEKNRKKERVKKKKKIAATLEQLVSHDWFVSSPLYLHMTHSFLTFKRKLNKMWWRISTTV